MLIRTTQHILTLVLSVNSTSTNENPVTGCGTSLPTVQNLSYTQGDPSIIPNGECCTCKDSCSCYSSTLKTSLELTDNSQTKEHTEKIIENPLFGIKRLKILIKFSNTKLFECKTPEEIKQHQSNVKKEIEKNFTIPLENVNFSNTENEDSIKFEDIVHYLLFDVEDIIRVLGQPKFEHADYKKIINNFYNKLQNKSLFLSLHDKMLIMLSKLGEKRSCLELTNFVLNRMMV